MVVIYDDYGGHVVRDISLIKLVSSPRAELGCWSVRIIFGTVEIKLIYKNSDDASRVYKSILDIIEKTEAAIYEISVEEFRKNIQEI